jgi:hypothetical protein
MHGTWSGLGLLLVVHWLAACVSGPPVRLETGQGAPLDYRPPADEPPPVRVSQEEFVSALTDLVLQGPMSLELPRREGRVVPASWSASACPPSEPADGCLVLPSNAPPPETLARLRLALSFANGEYADCYAPSNNDPRSILDRVARKVNEKQAERIILNLEDSQVELGALKQHLRENPIAELKEIIMIRGGKVILFHP